MILSSIFTKVQQLDSKIKILSEITPGLDRGMSVSFQTKTQKENSKVIMDKVNRLEKLVSQLKEHMSYNQLHALHTLDG